MSVFLTSHRFVRHASFWLAAVMVLVLALTGCASRPNPNTPSTSGAASQCDYPSAGEPSRPVDPPPTTGIETSGLATMTLQFTSGPMTITMDRGRAPCTVNSMVSLAQQGFFTGTRCHRLTDQGIFVLQCGDPTETGSGGPGYTVPDELTGSETYPPGTVAMANRGQPDTGGSQFFLVWQDTPLDPKYTVFGTLDAASLQLLTTIAAQGIKAGTESTPNADTTITEVTLG